MKKNIFIISFIILILDQISKLALGLCLKINESKVLIKNFFNLTFVYNDGAAFSILKNQRLLLILAGIISLYLLYKFTNDFKENKRNTLAFGLLIGGILGNLLDRIFLGYVRDFLDFRIFNYNYPVFNLSDCAIFVGVLLLIYAVFKGEEDGSKSKRRKN
jgi:signal peptidase II